MRSTLETWSYQSFNLESGSPIFSVPLCVTVTVIVTVQLFCLIPNHHVLVPLRQIGPLRPCDHQPPASQLCLQQQTTYLLSTHFNKALCPFYATIYPDSAHGKLTTTTGSRTHRVRQPQTTGLALSTFSNQKISGPPPEPTSPNYTWLGPAFDSKISFR